MIICIDGTPGSGKTTIAQKLSQKFKLKNYSMGELMRNIARRKNITLEELNKQRNKDSTIDRDVDNYQKDLGKEEDNFVITGRTSFHFIPHGIKIFLQADYKTAAERIFPDLQKQNLRNENLAKNPEELSKAIQHRHEGDRKRYMKFYNIDVCNAMQYDLVLNTTHLSEKDVFNFIVTFITAQKKA